MTPDRNCPCPCLNNEVPSQALFLSECQRCFRPRVRPESATSLSFIRSLLSLFNIFSVLVWRFRICRLASLWPIIISSVAGIRALPLSLKRHPHPSIPLVHSSAHTSAQDPLRFLPDRHRDTNRTIYTKESRKRIATHRGKYGGRSTTTRRTRGSHCEGERTRAVYSGLDIASYYFCFGKECQYSRTACGHTHLREG